MAMRRLKEFWAFPPFYAGGPPVHRHLYGVLVASHPVRFIMVSLAIVCASAWMAHDLQEEKSAEKLWISPDSHFVRGSQWLSEHFPNTVRPDFLLIVGEDVLQPKFLKERHIVRAPREAGGANHIEISSSMMSYCRQSRQRVEEARKLRKTASETEEKLQAEKRKAEEAIAEIDEKQRKVPELKDAEKMKRHGGTGAYIRMLLFQWKYRHLDLQSEDPSLTIGREEYCYWIEEEIKQNWTMLGSISDVLGGIERDSSGNITGARATRMLWFTEVNQSAVTSEDRNINLPQNYVSNKDVSDWEDGFLDFCSKYHLEGFQTYFYSMRSFLIIAVKSVLDDLNVLLIGYALVFLFVIGVLGKRNCVENRWLLSIAGLISIGFSTMTALGTCYQLGFVYGSMHRTMPFILLGIGIDDMFVIVQAFDNLPSVIDVPLKQRIGMAMRHAGMAITMTSLTDFLAFTIGATTASRIDFEFRSMQGPKQHIPAMNRINSLVDNSGITSGDGFTLAWAENYGNWEVDEIIQVELYRNLVLAVFCVFVVTLSFLASIRACLLVFLCVTLTLVSERRRPDVRVGMFAIMLLQWLLSIAGLISIGFSTMTALGTCYQLGFVYGSMHRTMPFILLGIGIDDMFVIVQAFDNLPSVIDVPLKQRIGMAMRHAGMAITMTSLTDFLAFTIGATTVLVCSFTTVLVAVSIFFFACLEQRFDRMWLLPEDSYLYQYFMTSQQYFPSHWEMGSVLIGAVNYTKELPNIVRLVGKIRADPAIASVSSWTDDFVPYYNTFHENNFPVVQNFSSILSLFLVSPTGYRYRSVKSHLPLEVTLVGRGRHNHAVDASRIDFEFRSMQGPKQHIPAMNRINSLVDHSGITSGDGFTLAWAENYGNWEVDEIIQVELYRNLLLAVFCVFVVTLSFLASIRACLLPPDYMHTPLTVDTFSCICLVLAVGLSVDYSCHIGHCFMVLEGSREERAREALGQIGPAVFCGGFTTFLAFAGLATSQSHIFKTFFKVFFGVVLFGLYYSLFLLPVLLSVIGPAPYQHLDTKYVKDKKEVNGNIPHPDSPVYIEVQKSEVMTMSQKETGDTESSRL
ncbi:unnamed protein product [Cyprideis torosa]|uniref:Uncharacterized protein n=1 Tax=Cyprideis torosa TaxID=163714 RepID=A0A7R8ZPB6_9CRUS|nr:unnamed protein product [Cyprideis torosa]CAG0900163.1 unnamed protein product [Cyprideis torosa]